MPTTAFFPPPLLRVLRTLRASAFLSLLLATANTAHASSFDQYGAPYHPVSLPPTGQGSFGLAADCLPSGRVVCVTGNQLFLESTPGSGSFSPVATFDPAQPAAGTADPAFIRVSPDGTHIAVGLGTNKPVAIIPTAALGTPGSPTLLNPASGTAYFNIPHTEAAWRNNSELALTAGSFGSPSRVTLLNTLSSPAAPSNPTIISNIGGASAGIAFDSTGRLYTGNGFDLSSPAAGPSQTGWIKAFSPSSWTSTPADFESSGSFIADILSATSLLFDHEGNLVIGGGDFDASDTGYLGVLSRNAIIAALLGGTIDTADPAQLKRLAPTGNPFEFYTSAYNPLTGELYASVTGFSPGDPNTLYATIPTPAAAALLALAGLTATRRRRS